MKRNGDINNEELKELYAGWLESKNVFDLFTAKQVKIYSKCELVGNKEVGEHLHISSVFVGLDRSIVALRSCMICMMTSSGSGKGENRWGEGSRRLKICFRIWIVKEISILGCPNCSSCILPRRYMIINISRTTMNPLSPSSKPKIRSYVRWKEWSHFAGSKITL